MYRFSTHLGSVEVELAVGNSDIWFVLKSWGQTLLLLQPGSLCQALILPGLHLLGNIK